MEMNGIIDRATGDLLRAGHSVFTPGPGEAFRGDVPIGANIRGEAIAAEFSRWDGNQWIKVPQPKTRKVILRDKRRAGSPLSTAEQEEALDLFLGV